MTSDEIDEARAVIQCLPGLDGDLHTIERLGGLTNRVYAIGAFVVRIPGKGTEEYINRMNEAEAARVAANVGVSPEVIYADARSGIMVTRRIADATTMSPEAFRTRKGTPARAGKVLRQLHTSTGVFPSRFELFAMIDEYLGVLSTKDVAVPYGYHDVVREAGAIRKALSTHPARLVPCHCDPLCENFIDTEERMWIVDWEYSGMNDPMWDLGDLSVEGCFDDAQDAELLRAYFGAEPSEHDHGRMVIYKAMCDLLWTLWGLIQLANQNPTDDFRKYADTRFSRCKSLMATPAFARHLAAVARG
jgi:thiamine kinase-like enzyme